MLRYLSERERPEHLSNVFPVVANQESPNIPEPVDVIVVVDTYHHIDDRPGYFNRLKKSLRPQGRLAIVDFKPDSPEGLPPEHRIPAEKVTEELKAAGLLARRDAFFLAPAILSGVHGVRHVIVSVPTASGSVCGDESGR